MTATAAEWTAESLFQRFFLPYYPAGEDLATLRSTDANPANNPQVLGALSGIADVFAKLAPSVLEIDEGALDYSDASVHHLGKALTRAGRDALIAASTDVPTANDPPLLVKVVTHGAVYVAECICRNHGGEWQVRRPLWESLVRLTSAAGTGDLAVFHWFLKALSDEEIDEPRLIDRYRSLVEEPMRDPTADPIIAPPDRRLPTLKKVRYDTLHQHLKAHLPELRFVGDDFPSAERFSNYGLTSLSFLLLGGGRQLLMHGPSPDGLHLFWLTIDGFRKAAFIPTDAFPAPVVDIDGDKLRIVFSHNGTTQRHEMLWWGS